VKHHEQGLTYVFRPKHSRGEEGQRSVRRLLKQVFAGDALSMFQHLLDAQDLSPEELAEFTKVINERREGEQR
jgi:predicted transcriptional regulator